MADPDPNAYVEVGSYRTHDGPPSQWLNIETEAGVYDWTTLDAVVDAWAGKTITYTLYGTPRFHAQEQFKDRPDGYGHLGGASPPADNSSIDSFVQALLLRYNSGETKKIKYLEIWNEPSFNQDGRDQFWWGTAVEMVAMANIIRQVANFDSFVKIVSPGFATLKAGSQFLAAHDAESGSYGWELIDVFALHPYGKFPYPPGDFVHDAGGILKIREELALYGIESMPIMFNEFAPAVPPAGPDNLAFLNSSALERKQRIARSLAICAVMGVKMFGLYAYSTLGTPLCGNFLTDVDGVQAAVNEVGAALCGKTVIGAQYSSDGILKVTRADGRTFYW